MSILSSSVSSSSGTQMNEILSGPPEINPEDVHFNPLTDRLGGGTFGDVYRAEIKGIKVAVKIPKKQVWDSEELRSFREEVSITRSAFHTNVVLFLGACTVPGSIMIVIERMACDLDTLLHHRERVPPALLKIPITLERKIKMAHDAALGIIWLHDILKVVHRDLKPANLLLDENLRVKVTDFGFSELYENKKGQEVEMKGTALYAAPEIWKTEGCSTASDVYSFGLILWEILTEEEPFLGYLEATDFYEDVIIKGARPVIPEYPVSSSSSEYMGPPTPLSLRKLITQCWDQNPLARPTMHQVRIQLENALLESQIEDPAARSFWQTQFRTGGSEGSLIEEVPWDRFCTELAKETGAPLFDIRALDQMFAPNDVVTRKRFNSIQKWFGEFFTEEGASILTEMSDVATADWFCGDITKDTADRWLTGRDDLTFLVRFSQTDAVNFPFTISKRKGGRNVHRRVQRLDYNPNKEERYSVDIREDPGYLTAPTLSELIEGLKRIGNIGAVCPKEELPTSNPYEASRHTRRLMHP